MTLPPLNLSASSSAKSGLDLGSASFSASGAGDWTVNFGDGNSSGPGFNAAGGVPVLWIVIALGAVWLILKK